MKDSIYNKRDLNMNFKKKYKDITGKSYELKYERNLWTRFNMLF